MNDNEKCLNFAMKLKSSELTDELIDRAVKISRNIDAVSYIIRRHLIAKGYPLEIVNGELSDSIARKLASLNIIDWSEVEKIDTTEVTGKFRPTEEVKEEPEEEVEKTECDSVKFYRRFRSIATNIRFKLDEKADFPENGFSYSTDNMKWSLSVVDVDGRYHMTLIRWEKTATYDDASVSFPDAFSTACFCQSLGIKTPKFFKKLAKKTVVPSISAQVPQDPEKLIIQELSDLANSLVYGQYELDDQSVWPEYGFSICNEDANIEIRVSPFSIDRVDIAINTLNKEHIAGGSLPDMETVVKEFTRLNLPVPQKFLPTH